MTADHFAGKAEEYEQNRERVANVENIAGAMRREIAFDGSMHVMDFGAGTGLLLERIAPHVGRMTAVDVSAAMMAQLRQKLASLPCPVEIVEADLTTDEFSGEFDGIISSMALHHVEQVEAMLGRFHALLRDGGFIAIADLAKEDGSFHGEMAGVFHQGFDTDELMKTVTAAGFREVRVSPASVIRKPQGDYPVFLLTARR